MFLAQLIAVNCAKTTQFVSILVMVNWRMEAIQENVISNEVVISDAIMNFCLPLKIYRAARVKKVISYKLGYLILILYLVFSNYFRDGFISNEELFTVLKMMTGDNLTDVQLQQIVNRTILYLDQNSDGKIGMQEFIKGKIR